MPSIRFFLLFPTTLYFRAIFFRSSSDLASKLARRKASTRGLLYAKCFAFCSSFCAFARASAAKALAAKSSASLLPPNLVRPKKSLYSSCDLYLRVASFAWSSPSVAYDLGSIGSTPESISAERLTLEESYIAFSALTRNGHVIICSAGEYVPGMDIISALRSFSSAPWIWSSTVLLSVFLSLIVFSKSFRVIAPSSASSNILVNLDLPKSPRDAL